MSRLFSNNQLFDPKATSAAGPLLRAAREFAFAAKTALSEVRERAKVQSGDFVPSDRRQTL